jgi:cytochrome c-type biogenesis protein CcmH
MKPLPPGPAAAQTAHALLRITIDIAPELKSTLKPTDVLFVVARQPNGPPMPVAAKRLPVATFPVTVELSDNDSPMPTMKLSQTGAVEVIARISRTGAANRAMGDLESSPLTAQSKPGAHYNVRIDQVAK